MTDLTLFLLLTLSTYYLFYLISLSSLLQRPREAFYDYCPYDSHRAAYRHSWNKQERKMYLVGRVISARTLVPTVSRWGQLVHCPWCLGFWLSLITVYATDQKVVSLSMPLLWVGGVACGVGLIGMWMGEKERGRNGK